MFLIDRSRGLRWRSLRQLFVLLPTSCHRLLCLAQEKLGHGGFALLQHTVATFGVDIVLQRNLWITRVELEGILVLVEQARVVAVKWPIARIDSQLLLAHPLRHVDSMSNALTVSDDQ